MLLRALLTTAFVAVGTAAALIVDCTTTIIDLFNDELSNVCDSVDLLGASGGLRVGVGLGVFVLLGLLATWGPYVKDKLRLRRHEPVRALADNLPRLAEVGTNLDEIEDVPTLAELATARLMNKVEAVESSIISEAIPTREATQQWMRLLRQANDLHNDGTLDTEVFKKINTRLLDLFSAP